MRQQVGLLAARQRELADEQNALQVLSPLTGKVLDWNADEQLTGKPVAVGERLFSVADTAGPWELDLFVDEIDSGHVLQAQQADGPREVTFCLLSQPGTRHRGVVQEIGSVAETTGPGVRGLRVRVAVPQDQALDAPEGASVAAKIRCERSSLAHAWFHELWEYLQGRVFF